LTTQLDARIAATMTRIAAGVALVVAALVPCVYLLMAWQALERETWLKAQVKAEMVGSFAARWPDTWTLQDLRMLEMLRRDPAKIGTDVARVLDASGAPLVEVGDAREPVHWHRQPVHDAGTLVGYVEVGRSIVPLLAQAAAFVALGLSLAVISFVALRTLPVRALRRAIGALSAHLRYEEKVSHFGAFALTEHEREPLIRAAIEAIREGLPDARVSYAASLQAVAADTILMPVGAAARSQGALTLAPAAAGEITPEAARFAQSIAHTLSAALQRVEAETQLRAVAEHDALTHLPNRSLLADRFAQHLALAARQGTHVAVLYIDLDGFKAVNDTMGHAGGDDLLAQLAARLSGLVRSSDTVGRLAGDEFAIVCSGLARPEDAGLMAEKVMEANAAGYAIDGKEVFISASIGIAVYPADGDSVETLLAAADAAMYRAKQSGRDTYRFFTAEMYAQSRHRAQQAVDLRRALGHGEFLLHYQPIVAIGTGRVVSVEALLRWRQRDGRLAPAGEFIATLEETGLIREAGEWALRRACEDLAACARAGQAAMPVAVNLSARQFRQPDLEHRIAFLLAELGVHAQLIEIEVTESQLMSHPDDAVRILRALRAQGLRITIDDFGTGYSSLAYLTRFPVQCLKIDRSFIREVASDARQATLVRTIVEMARGLGIAVAAEGVETAEQLRLLELMGCDYAQGWLYGQPMPLEALLASLAPSGAPVPAAT